MGFLLNFRQNDKLGKLETLCKEAHSLATAACIKIGCELEDDYGYKDVVEATKDGIVVRTEGVLDSLFNKYKISENDRELFMKVAAILRAMSITSMMEDIHSEYKGGKNEAK